MGTTTNCRGHDDAIRLADAAESVCAAFVVLYCAYHVRNNNPFASLTAHLSVCVLSLHATLSGGKPPPRLLHHLRRCHDPIGLPAGASLLCAASLVFRNPILLSASVFTLCTAYAFDIVHTSLINGLISALLLRHADIATVIIMSAVPVVAYITVLACRGSFTFAEAGCITAAVGSAIRNAIHDIIISTATTDMSTMDKLIRAGIAGCAIIWTCCILPAAWQSQSYTPTKQHGQLHTYGPIFLSVIALTYSYVRCVVLPSTTTPREPVSWVFSHIFERAHRIQTVVLLAFWACLLLIMFIVFPPDKLSPSPTIVKRKFYHFIALLIFLPPLSSSWPFILSLLNLCILPALALLLLIEVLRCSSSPSSSLRTSIHKFTQAVIDERDQGCVIATHLFLLMGCAVPSLLSSPTAPAVSVAGIVAVCVQDSVAAIVGSKWGSIPFGRRNRSLQGSLAGIISVLMFMLVWSFAYFWAFPGHLTVHPFVYAIHVVVAAIATMVMEAFTDQVDNWVVPMTFCTVLAAPIYPH